MTLAAGLGPFRVYFKSFVILQSNRSYGFFLLHRYIQIPFKITIKIKAKWIFHLANDPKLGRKRNGKSNKTRHNNASNKNHRSTAK